MKKILYTSTALVAAGLFVTGTASASDKINLELGGFSKWWVVGAWNSSGYLNAAHASYDNVDLKGDNEVWFGGNTTLDNGMKVGVDIHLEAGGHTDMTTDTIDKAYVYVEGGFGKFIVGTQNNGTALLHVQAPDAAGNWNQGGMMTGNYSIVKPGTVNEMGGGNTTAIQTANNSEAITYVAPTFYGLTVGGSFLPHPGVEDNRGNINLNSVATNGSGTVVGGFQQVYGVGALYANTFGGVGVKVSAGAIQGRLDTYNIPVNASWFEQAYGTQLSYAGFTLGGSYRHQQAAYGSGTVADLASLGAVTTQGNGSLGNGRAYDVGLQYATGPYAVSFDYYNSHVAHTDTTNLTTALAAGLATNDGAANNGHDMVDMYQLSGKYNMGPGVDILASTGYAVYNSALGSTAGGDTNHNSGWVVMSGLDLTF